MLVSTGMPWGYWACWGCPPGYPLMAGKLHCVAHSGVCSGWGSVMLMITSTSVSWCPWCRGHWQLHACILKALPGSPPGPQRGLTAYSWVTLDPAGQWGRPVWEKCGKSPGSLTRPLTQGQCLRPGPCPWCLSNLLCRNSVLCLSDSAFALMIWLPCVTWTSLIRMDLSSDHTTVVWSWLLPSTHSYSSGAVGLHPQQWGHCPTLPLHCWLAFPCGAGPPLLLHDSFKILTAQGVRKFGWNYHSTCIVSKQ